jgi:N-acetylmuramoyl-L-alanine amidase
LTPSRKFAAVLPAALAAAAAIAFSLHAQLQGSMPAQPSSAPASMLNHNLILLDPAHGGPDPGATLSDRALEKDVTLALAARLRTTLTAAGFTVIATRDADPSVSLTPDQRAEIANRTHAVACIVLHATTAGSGTHIYTSTLQPPPPDEDAYPSAYVPIPWEMAQAASVGQSQRLAGDLASAFTKGSLPVVSGQAALRPLDNLMCPAVAVELGPLLVPGQDPTAPTDDNYQQRVVSALTSALQTWRDHADASSGAGNTTEPGAAGLASETSVSRQLPQPQASQPRASRGQP